MTNRVSNATRRYFSRPTYREEPAESDLGIYLGNIFRKQWYIVRIIVPVLLLLALVRHFVN